MAKLVSDQEKKIQKLVDDEKKKIERKRRLVGDPAWKLQEGSHDNSSGFIPERSWKKYSPGSKKLVEYKKK